MLYFGDSELWQKISLVVLHLEQNIPKKITAKPSKILEIIKTTELILDWQESPECLHTKWINGCRNALSHAAKSEPLNLTKLVWNDLLFLPPFLEDFEGARFVWMHSFRELFPHSLAERLPLKHRRSIYLNEDIFCYVSRDISTERIFLFFCLSLKIRFWRLLRKNRPFFSCRVAVIVQSWNCFFFRQHCKKNSTAFKLKLTSMKQRSIFPDEPKH